MQGSCRVYVWMLDKKNVMYDPDTFGYTVVGKHVFFLQKDKNQNILIPHNGSKRLFNFLDTKIPPMTDGVFEWVYNILSLIHISEPTRQDRPSRMPSSA